MTAAAALVLTACGGGGGGGSGAEPAPAEPGVPSLGAFTFLYGVPFETSTQGAPLAVAKQMGYWSDQGLEVDLKVVNGGTAAAQGVISGNADASVGSSANLLNALAAGQPQPLISFDVFVHTSTYNIIVPADSPARALADLRDQTIGVVTLAQDDAVAAKNILGAAQGVPPAEIRQLPVGAAATALEAFKSNSIAAWSASDNDRIALEQLGFPIRTLPLPEISKSALDTTFVTKPEYLRTDREKLIAFGRGVARAITFCNANVDACIKAYWRAYPNAAPPNAESDFPAASRSARAQLEAEMPKIYAADGRWGEMTLESWAAMAELQGITTLSNDQLQTLFTNELADGISDFDPAKPISDAASFS